MEVAAAEGGDAPVEEFATDEAASGTQAIEQAVEETPEQADAKAKAARIALFEEKLIGAREKRQAQRIADRAKADRKAAAEERRLAAEEKQRYAGLKEGSFKDTLTALGKDPRQVFEEMQREAIEASTPEAAAKRAQAELDEKFARQQDRIDALEKERTDALEAQRTHAHMASLHSHFQKAVADPAFKDLRIEYPDEALLDHAQYYDKHPGELREHARTYGVRLTAPEKGFTMHELLQVLSAAQAAHDTAKQARIAATAPPEAQQLGKAPTVNGTAERRNAGTVTNDLASQRASPGPKVSGSVKERLAASIEEEIRRYSGG